MATRNFAANLKIGAAMSSSVGRVFGGLKTKIKDQEAALKKLRAEFKTASKGSGEFAGSLDKLQAEIGQAEAKLKKLKAAAKFDIGASMRGIGSAFAGDMKRLGAAAGIAGAAIVGVGASIYSVTRGFVDWADDIGDTAEALEVSTQALQTWQFAASTVGVNAAAMSGRIAKFQKGLADGGKGVEEGLGALGVNMARLKKLKTEEQLEVVAEAFKSYKGDIPKAALAMKLFGRSGYQLAGVLSKGEEGLRQFREEGLKMGAVLDDAAAAKAGEAATALDSFGMTMTGLRNIIALEFVPSLKRLAERFTKLIRDNGPKIREWAARFGVLIETKVVPALVTFADKLPGIMTKLGEMAEKFWTGLNAVKDFLGGWDNLGIAILAVNFAPTILALGGLAKGLYGVGTASYAALGPWGLLAAAVLGFFTAVGDGNPWEGLKFSIRAIGREGEALWGILKEGFTEFGQWLGPNLEVLLSSIKDSFDTVSNWIGRNWAVIEEVVTNTVARLKSIFDTLAKDIRDAFTSVFDWIGTKFDDLYNKAAALGAAIKGFFSFGGGGKETSMNTAPSVAPPDSMPARDRGTAQNNEINIRIDAPGQDGTGIARQLRQELNRRPLFDTDGALVPG